MMPPLTPAELAAADTLIDLGLAEDLGDGGDITSDATIPAEARGSAWFVARRPGVIAGLPVVARLADRMGLGDGWMAQIRDGTAVAPGERVARVEGPMRVLLQFERTALNFLQHLSGVATLTAHFVEAVSGTKASILDTRKTLPGWRLLDKYAVRCGGGKNHRIGLYDGVLIKDNHLAWLAKSDAPFGPVYPGVTVRADLPEWLRVKSDPVGAAIASARGVTSGRDTIVEIEVDSLDQLDRALECRPDIILVDNFDAARLRESVRRRDAVAREVQIEASGGVNLESVRTLAQAGVDRISVGALTHSAPALDLGLDFDAATPP